MASWFPSWLQLPSIDISLPSAIQRRFISFILKRSLGHLLKPGQLDVQQIDSQIGSGYVQVRDLELDHDAINALLIGLPVKLHDGSMSSVTARIPWPNPLTANIGFSIQSLHLVFHIGGHAQETTSNDATNLADSVVSVAESFMHDELSPGEEATLRESLHPDLANSATMHETVPGALDPFLSTDEEFHSEMDPTGVSIFATMIERLLSRFEFDASDTIITLVLPGRSSFSVKLSEIRYGRYTQAREEPGRQDSDASSEVKADPDEAQGETRTLSLSGFALTYSDIRPVEQKDEDARDHPASSPVSLEESSPTLHLHPSPIPSPPSPYQSDSDLEDGADNFMSQSLVSLPPRPPGPPLSPASTVGDSMYQSAISTIPEVFEGATLVEAGSSTQSEPVESSAAEIPSREEVSSTSTPAPYHTSDHQSASHTDVQCETIISLASAPLIIQMTTSLFGQRPPAPPSSSPSAHPSSLPPRSRALRDLGKVRIHISLGILACALRARHVRDIGDVVDALDSSAPPSRSPPTKKKDGRSDSKSSPFSMLNQLETSFDCAAVVVLLLPSSGGEGESYLQLEKFFSSPLLPPSISGSCLRVLVEGITSSASVVTPSTTTSSAFGKASNDARPSVKQPPASTMTLVGRLSIDDLSVFVFDISANDAIPILITDSGLPLQYLNEHCPPPALTSLPPERLRRPTLHNLPQLPSFIAPDWTRPDRAATNASPSEWRLPSFHRDTRGQASGSSSPSHIPASQRHAQALTIEVRFSTKPADSQSHKTTRPDGNQVSVDIHPLHMFLDLGLLASDDSHANEIFSYINLLANPAASPPKNSEPATCNRQSEDFAGNEDYDDESSEDHTPPATPQARRAMRAREQAKQRERERKRLEKLVLDDLDLSFDYRQEDLLSKPATSSRTRRKKSAREDDDKTRFTLRIPMIRIQIRCPPPIGKGPRSGAFILDIHSIALHSHSPTQSLPLSTRFADQPDPSVTRHTSHANNEQHIVTVEWRRIVLAYSGSGDTQAIAFVSLGWPSKHETSAPHSLEQRSASSVLDRVASISLVRTRGSNRSDTRTSSRSLPALVVAVDVPSVHVEFTKAIFDGLQFWADDVSQFAEHFSRFMTMQRKPQKEDFRTMDTGHLDGRQSTSSETLVKLNVSEAYLRVMLAQDEGPSPSTRPLDILASDIDVLLEVAPEGKDETMLTLSVMDVNIMNFYGSPGQLLLSSFASEGTLLRRPLLKLGFNSLVDLESKGKESRVNVTLFGFLFDFHPDMGWLEAVGRFVKSPPGAFESVVPSERTRIAVKVNDGSIRLFAPVHAGALVLHIGDFHFSTEIAGNSSELKLLISAPSLAVLLTDDNAGHRETDTPTTNAHNAGPLSLWKLELCFVCGGQQLGLVIHRTSEPETHSEITVEDTTICVHLCADTGTALGAFLGDFASAFSKPAAGDDTVAPSPIKVPVAMMPESRSSHELMASVDDRAFQRVPEVGAAPDLISDDLPSNLEYLDESFGAAAGLRDFDDEVFDDEFHDSDVGNQVPASGDPGVTSRVGGETIKLLRPEGIDLVEKYFDNLPPISEEAEQPGGVQSRVTVTNSEVKLFLYEGYDWSSTRKTIEHETKEMKRRLARIRQLVASGQTYDANVDETSVLLFNSVYLGLEQDLSELEPSAAIAAIDEELNDEEEDPASESSWQSLRHQSTSKTPPHPARSTRSQSLVRSRGPSIEFKLMGLNAEFSQYLPENELVSRMFATVKDVEILDHVKTSTWRKFLTALWSDSHGNVRESGSNMVRVELRTVHPVPGNTAEEARLRAKILPLRLHVDQDALDFLKKFFSFKDPSAAPPQASGPTSNEIYFQQAEVFPVGLKLDYKPRRVDYRALRDGKTIELMNFFHFDGAEMTLRHITLFGVTGWARFFDLLNDLWTPDVKATQLAEVISGVAPIRSIVNVGSGVADLVLLPIAQYRKDGRVVRGVQKGTKAFVKTTAMEAVKLGARLATGTQVILEQAEDVLGTQFNESITTETVQVLSSDAMDLEGSQEWDGQRNAGDLISRYAEQPGDVKEGIQSAYTSLKRNLNSAAQTILAVPMEVYERSGNEGPVRAVIRAVPIAVLKPMIGASEAVSKALMGIHNSMDPDVRRENEEKYKHR
ncbi:hypothetical protein EVG20_g338 [Dentipellis fragilis]|uniref:Autophagy-related protein 2 n=1 Tax=Dentipellis fragilis TaxID=205917 RepID=A0A4Y9ZFX6_9AGAM|nr:hypothetical protein EVG20_g338 [Dentipellis fragilis]